MLFSENIKVSSKGLSFSDKHGNPLTFAVAMGKAVTRIYNWWLDFKLFLVHLVSLHVPFHSVRKLVFKLAGAKIGTGSTLHMGCKFFEPRGVSIGDDTKVGDRAFLDGRAKLAVGSHVDIASEVMIYNSEHDINSKDFGAKDAQVIIEDYCFIGPRVIILPGVKIGKGAVIGAGAVVTKDVKPFEISTGVPARPIGVRTNKKLSYRLGRARLFQ